MRWLILQTVLAAGIVALYLSGSLREPFTGESRWFVAGVLGFVALGILAMARNRFDDAAWIRDVLPVIAVLGMQLGIISGLSFLGAGLASGGDTTHAVGGFLSAISVAFYVSVTALAGHLWLRLNLKLLAPAHEV